MDMVMEDNNTSTEGCGMPSMAMYFHTEHCQYILFEAFKTTTNGGLTTGCVCVFIFAFLYEGLKTLRDHCLSWLPVRPTKSLNPDIKRQRKWTWWRDLFTYGHMLQTVLHMVQIMWSYSMMLVFMTYNTWLCLALILGATSGYFVFGSAPRIQRDSFEHCH
ncbi:high affinity copper uptake protein 1-like [Pecten maximus]|uniref:high affinity copper uptake protein 1-like n=1 Tax=Pecten maximus TaxID=6579 RepID=UPI0014583D75|nr:high affinity copper uptake protein 1-like [Pecten maximus]